MNNTFDFNRFKNLLFNDGKMYLRNFGTSLLVICCLPAANWIFTLIFGYTPSGGARLVYNYILAAIAMMLMPSKVYGHANLSREGVGFAMMPTSSLEKFISMFLYCVIVTPLVAFFGSYLIDALLSFLPFGGFEKPIHIYGINEFINLKVNDSANPIRLNTPTESIFLSLAVAMRVSFYVSIIQWSAIFMLGNMLFKKHKAGKTFACYLGISYFISLILSLIFFNKGIMEKWMAKINDMSTEQQIQLFQNGMNWSLVIGIIITVLLLYFTYRKIKTQKY